MFCAASHNLFHQAKKDSVCCKATVEMKAGRNGSLLPLTRTTLPSPNLTRNVLLLTCRIPFPSSEVPVDTASIAADYCLTWPRLIKENAGKDSNASKLSLLPFFLSSDQEYLLRDISRRNTGQFLQKLVNNAAV